METIEEGGFMRGYRLTKKGIIVAGAIVLLGIISRVLGSVYFAVFVFAFCAISLGCLAYELFLNKSVK